MKHIVATMVVLTLAACATAPVPAPVSPVESSFRECLAMGGNASYVVAGGLAKFECKRGS